MSWLQGIGGELVRLFRAVQQAAQSVTTQVLRRGPKQPAERPLPSAAPVTTPAVRPKSLRETQLSSQRATYIDGGRIEGGGLEPGRRIYAVGDIHGRADLLANLVARIEDDCKAHDGPVSIVFLGDYVDRGFQSRQVIDLLLGERLSRFDLHCLKGNHEEAMLTFLADPAFGPKWAAYGGRETLVSYGIRPPRSMTRIEEWEEVHGDFVRALPREHELFLMGLAASTRIGPFGFVHAGVKPGVSFAAQSERDLLWIREEFLKSNETHELMIVHGHTPVDQPYKDGRRINVDTGAYFSGRLTAVRLEADTVSFLSTST